MVGVPQIPDLPAQRQVLVGAPPALEIGSADYCPLHDPNVRKSHTASPSPRPGGARAGVRGNHSSRIVIIEVCSSSFPPPAGSAELFVIQTGASSPEPSPPLGEEREFFANRFTFTASSS